MNCSSVSSCSGGEAKTVRKVGNGSRSGNATPLLPRIPLLLRLCIYIYIYIASW
jgi:hypothetical protein